MLSSAGVEATLKLPRRATYAEYLAVEQLSHHRHEFLDGVVVAMAGGSDEHNAIAGRLAMLLGQRVVRGCRYYSADQRFWVAARSRGRYSDGSVICGKPEHPLHDDQATTNPVVVVEVLSPTTEGDDDGDKRVDSGPEGRVVDFQSLSSLQAYVLAAQDRRHVVVYRRDEGGQWGAEPDVYDDGATFKLPTLTAAIAVSDVYEDILQPDGRSLLR